MVGWKIFFTLDIRIEQTNEIDNWNYHAKFNLTAFYSELLHNIL